MNNFVKKQINFIKMSKKKGNIDEKTISIETTKLKEEVKIPREFMYCSKREEDGKIKCQVFFDIEFIFEDEEEFLRYFDVQKNEI